MNNKNSSSNPYDFKESTLYIIGNGFDLHHSIKSKYQDFHKYIKENNSNIESYFESYFELVVDADSLWSDFENDLKTFNSQFYFEDHCAISTKDWINQEEPKWSDYFGVQDEINAINESMYKEICDSFFKWVKTLSATKVSKRNMKFDSNAKFLSFNYTLTLEKLYSIPSEKILHVHGDIENSNSLNLVFGHEGKLKKINEFDKNGDSNRVPWSDAENASFELYNKFKKPVQSIIKKNMHFFNSLNNIQNIIVLGHSLNKIDMPYFKKIKNAITKKCKWIFVYYEKDEKEEITEKAKKLGLTADTEQYQLLTWEEFNNRIVSVSNNFVV